MIQESVKKSSPFLLTKDPLQTCLTHYDIYEFECDNYIREVNTFLTLPNYRNLPPWTIKYETLPDLAKEPILPSIQLPPQLEVHVILYVCIGFSLIWFYSLHYFGMWINSLGSYPQHLELSLRSPESLLRTSLHPIPFLKTNMAPKNTTQHDVNASNEFDPSVLSRGQLV